MTDVSEAFDVTLCVYLAFHQVTGCVLLLECSSLEPEALGENGLLTLILFQQLIQTSVIFELVSSKSGTLGDYVYGLPWESMDTRNQKIVLQFLAMVQPALGLKVCGMVPVGVVTMSTIIRNTFSYYVMLRALAD